MKISHIAGWAAALVLGGLVAGAAQAQTTPGGGGANQNATTQRLSGSNLSGLPGTYGGEATNRAAGGRGLGGAATIGNPAEVGEAQKAVKAAGVDCQAIDGKLRGRGTYEVACRDGFGWVVMETKGGAPKAYDCLALAASVKANGGGGSACMLPLNNDAIYTGQALATRAHAACKVRNAVWLGGGGDPGSAISRYEMSCEGAPGVIIDAPQPGSKADISVTSCKDAEAFGMKCTLPPAKG